MLRLAAAMGWSPSDLESMTVDELREWLALREFDRPLGLDSVCEAIANVAIALSKGAISRRDVLPWREDVRQQIAAEAEAADRKEKATAAVAKAIRKARAAAAAKKRSEAK